MDKIKLSVVVLTKNEEANIKDCLESVRDWADEIIVVDDESSDRTVDIVKGYTQNIFRKKMDIEGRHRNWAYAQAKNDWVLSLDADEMVTEELKEEIKEAIEDKSKKFVAYSIPLKNYIGDYWVRFGGWYPAGKVRLFQKNKFKYEEVAVHPRVFIDGECGHLTKDIIHKGYPDFAHFLNSLNNQTTLEAQKWLDTGRVMSCPHAFWRAIDRFFRSFIRKKAYKDGLIGFMIAYFASLYQILSYAKYRQMKLERSKVGNK
jgi:glycosyltransferase involved in cell wall biosynthesis